MRNMCWHSNELCRDKNLEILFPKVCRVNYLLVRFNYPKSQFVRLHAHKYVTFCTEIINYLIKFVWLWTVQTFEEYYSHSRHICYF